MTQFHATLSERSVYMRYFSAMTLSSRVEHERLVRVCFPDYEHGMALVADREDPGTGKHEILGVGRFAGSRDQGEAEAAIIVSDRWQERGLGTQLLRQLVQVAKAEGFNRLTGEVLRDNIAMQRLLKRSGFHFSPLDGATLRAQMDI